MKHFPRDRYADIHRGPERLGEILKRAGYMELLTPLGKLPGDGKRVRKAQPKPVQRRLF